jgi:hypothetical protein
MIVRMVLSIGDLRRHRTAAPGWNGLFLKIDRNIVVKFGAGAQ